MQYDLKCIVGNCARTLAANVSGKAFGIAEKQECLIDQVRAKIEKQAASGFASFPPCAGAKLRTKAVEVRLVSCQFSKNAGSNQLAYRKEISMPAGILVNRYQPLAFGRQFDQLFRFLQSCGEGLIDDYMLSRQQALSRQRIMRCIRRRDYNQGDPWKSEHLFHAANQARIRIKFRGIVSTALEDRSQSHTGNSMDHRRMKSASGSAKTDQACADHVHTMRGIKAFNNATKDVRTRSPVSSTSA